MRLYCWHCGKVVSTEVPQGTKVRATTECPECTLELEKQEKDYQQALIDVIRSTAIGEARSIAEQALDKNTNTVKED
jgi:hypothetical protein